ncbi:MAG: hypothetical protein QOK38_450 [Acidobacteriaceae bacterium]|jgi:hypothetical protein|nr:hypothetical protein [Acidobacteriaceae bacterium]
MRYAWTAGLMWVVLFGMAGAARASSSGCAVPPGFKDTPHPAIAPADQLVAHTEEIVIDRPLQTVFEAMDKPLKETIRQSNALPGVAGDFMLTKGEFGAPGSRHIVCLTDGGSVEEESLERGRNGDVAWFRYIVWNYRTPKARPIAYGVGSFRTVQIDGSHTRVTWTYSFRLKDDVFPGELGALGEWLFRMGFLDREYAAMMRGVLEGYKTAAETPSAAAGATPVGR